MAMAYTPLLRPPGQVLAMVPQEAAAVVVRWPTSLETLHLQHGQVLGMVRQAAATVEARLQRFRMGWLPLPSRLGPVPVTACPPWKPTALLVLRWPRPGENLQEITAVVSVVCLLLQHLQVFLPAELEAA